jgi:hypothetical protein
MLRNTSGYTVGAKVGANELFAYIATLYGHRWFAENGMVLGQNISLEAGRPAWGYVLKNTTDMAARLLRSLWALSARLGYPDGGVPSSVLLQQMMDIVGMPDPTAFADTLYAEADRLNGNMLLSKVYWNAMVDAPQKTLPADVCKVINYPSADAVFSLDAVKAAQEGAAYPI